MYGVEPKQMEELVWFLGRAILNRDKDKITELLNLIIDECNILAATYDIKLNKDKEQNGH